MEELETIVETLWRFKMNIEQEITKLQEQIDSLKKKQKEKDKVEVCAGQLFIDTKNCGYKVIIFNIDSIWGYLYDDGSGKTFLSKESLEKHLSYDYNGFVFYSKTCVF